ncbi:MAG: aldehyde dehydrogenase family protein [Candidatus Marinimicrobia bacterium]|nr:aldehyde dehydrogenase family protein [Candidatus Neomarinimicrobiota bacterium]|tara:strand:- start:521 stop:1918 length:1398 start_codon:yes stop_codon:yes gene_type:complete
MIRNKFNNQLEFSSQLRNSDFKQRIVKIKKIKNWIYLNKAKIRSALSKDLSRPELETNITEILTTVDMANDIIKNLKKWMAPKSIPSSLSVITSKSSIEYYPKGTVLIISPWNFPFQLCIAPLLYSIAAGNTAIIKPSEMTPATSNLVYEMVNELFEEKEVCVIEGAVEESQQLLELPFNHIFFTGSTLIGKKVVQASSKYLSSFTLELGGKSPVIIDKGFDSKKVINRLITTKFMNMGQTCIAPDYLVVHDDDYDNFLNQLINTLNVTYGKNFNDQLNSKSLGRIVNDKHLNRLVDLLENYKSKILYGGDYSKDDLFVAPTIIDASSNEKEPLEQEIFGPIIPIVRYSSEQELEKIISNINTPLALYIFSSNKKFISKIKNNTSSGGLCINDMAAHFLNFNLPFGGVMSSGSGRYHGFSGFKEFSNQRSILHQSRINLLSIIGPPYTDKINKLVEWILVLYKKL